MDQHVGDDGLDQALHSSVDPADMRQIQELVVNVKVKAKDSQCEQGERGTQSSVIRTGVLHPSVVGDTNPSP